MYLDHCHPKLQSSINPPPPQHILPIFLLVLFSFEGMVSCCSKWPRAPQLDQAGPELLLHPPPQTYTGHHSRLDTS